MQMGDDGRTAGQLDQAEPPRQPLAEEKVVAVVQDGARKQFPLLRLRLPGPLNREALLARFSRRVLHRSASAALLQLEAAERRGGGEAERDAAARRRRQ